MHLAEKARLIKGELEQYGGNTILSEGLNMQNIFSYRVCKYYHVVLDILRNMVLCSPCRNRTK